MSKTSGQKDPSMDEILGSIRRIITEDNAQSGQPGDATVAAPEADEEDILELTDEVGAAVGDEPRLDPTLAPAEPIVESAGPEERKEPVLGIHAPSAPQEFEPEPVAPEAPVTEPPAVFEEAPSDAPEPAASVFGAAPQQEEPAMTISDEPEAASEAQPDAGAGGIVSDTASSATAAALGDLNRAVDEKVSRLKLGEGDTSVSDLVKEMIRPMLREWLDANLPGIVERVVRREIQKLVDQTQDDD